LGAVLSDSLTDGHSVEDQNTLTVIRVRIKRL